MTNMLENYLKTLNKKLLEIGNKFVSDMKQNYKNLFQSFKIVKQDFYGEKAGARELVDIFANIKSVL